MTAILSRGRWFKFHQHFQNTKHFKGQRWLQHPIGALTETSWQLHFLRCQNFLSAYILFAVGKNPYTLLVFSAWCDLQVPLNKNPFSTACSIHHHWVLDALNPTTSLRWYIIQRPVLVSCNLNQPGFNATLKLMDKKLHYKKLIHPRKSV